MPVDSLGLFMDPLSVSWPICILMVAGHNGTSHKYPLSFDGSLYYTCPKVTLSVAFGDALVAPGSCMRVAAHLLVTSWARIPSHIVPVSLWFPKCGLPSSTSSIWMCSFRYVVCLLRLLDHLSVLVELPAPLALYPFSPCPWFFMVQNGLCCFWGLICDWVCGPFTPLSFLLFFSSAWILFFHP